MSDAPYQHLLGALLDSWDRNNTILLNLLRLLPDGALDARAAEESPTVAAMFAHVHFVRLIFVHEDAPDIEVVLPKKEWARDRDRDLIAKRLSESAKVVRDAVRLRLESHREMAVHYDHPILMLQHMIWHEGYHHGQIKLALKAAGLPLDDDLVSPGTWGVWMNKSASASRVARA